jgi:hypothetical protein
MKPTVENEVQGRFDLLPNFFRLEPESPEITANLWALTGFAYLDNACCLFISRGSGIVSDGTLVFLWPLGWAACQQSAYLPPPTLIDRRRTLPKSANGEFVC